MPVYCGVAIDVHWLKMASTPPLKLIDDLAHDKRLSVLLPMRGLTDDFTELFERLCNTLGDDDEVIICDNSEEPHTNVFRALTELQAEHRPATQFRYMCNLENIGAQLSSINALKLARGRYVTWIGDDDYWTDTYFHASAEFLEENPDFAAVAGSVRMFTKDVMAEVSRSCMYAEPTAVERLKKLHTAQAIGRYDKRTIDKPVQFVHMIRHTALDSFRRFIEQFNGRLDLYQCFTAPSHLLFGKFRTLEDHYYYKDQENWYPHESLVKTWENHYRVRGFGRVSLAHQFVHVCAQLFLFGRLLQRRHPELLPAGKFTDVLFYQLEYRKAAEYFHEFSGRSDLSSDELAFLDRFPLTNFPPDDPIKSTRESIKALAAAGFETAPVMERLFRELVPEN